MNLFFLGTGAGIPSKHRNVSSAALQMLQEENATWLFDCGEATQHQILRTNIKPRKVEKVFITHLHGDHIFGLPGFLSSRSFQGGDKPLTVYGPAGIKEFIETNLRVSGTRLSYPLLIEEIEEGMIYNSATIQVTCRKLDHSLDSYAFRIQEKDRPGELQPEKLKKAGIEPGPVYRKIKENPITRLDSGSLIYRADFLGPPKPGRVITICGDTRYLTNLADFVRHSNVLVHEATLSEADEHLAYSYAHSSTRQAAALARDANVKRLILTHISSRYQEEEMDNLLQEARETFPATDIAYDFFETEIPFS